jgi:DnaJ family protein B protein 4
MLHVQLCAGDERPGHIAADMVFIIDEKPHARFKREGDNLLLTKRISLSDALCGTEFAVQTLDGRTITVSTKDEVITPHTSKTVR